MSGHSKWKNIMHKKGKTDAQRAKIFTKIGREISVCVKEGGGDPTSNYKLRDLIAKARLNNVPSDNVERLIKKASGDGDGNNYEAITYEGYGPCGVAIIVETLTDNRNRTAGDLRHYFDKFGGNMGTSGSVAWMFNRKGIFVIENTGFDADEVMLSALEAGAEDFLDEGEAFTITTAPEEFQGVYNALEAAGYTFIESEIELVPDTFTSIDDEALKIKMSRLLETFEDNDDVQNVYHNYEE